jgi:RHS repeat-associated protein
MDINPFQSLARNAPLQTVNYTKFDRTKDIEEGDYKLTLDYGPYKNRKKTVLEYQNSVTQTRYYSGGYEKTINTVSGVTTIQEVHYIGCGNGVTVAYVIEGTTSAYHYLHTDYLGSILAVSSPSGTLEYEQNFDAWGRDRNPADWSYTGSATPRPSWLYRGFTGHEHLREFTLINMNARMYDTETGRMLAVDNYVLDAHNSQDYNRYSYARNNPLKFTDPDGEFVVAAVVIGAVVGAYLGGSTANGTFNPGKWDYSNSATWIGMGAGALVGGISGGLVNSGQVAIAGGVTVAGVTVGQVTLSSNRGVNELNVSSGERSYSLASWGSEENSNLAQANSFSGDRHANNLGNRGWDGARIEQDLASEAKYNPYLSKKKRPSVYSIHNNSEVIIYLLHTDGSDVYRLPPDGFTYKAWDGVTIPQSDGTYQAFKITNYYAQGSNLEVSMGSITGLNHGWNEFLGGGIRTDTAGGWHKIIARANKGWK